MKTKTVFIAETGHNLYFSDTNISVEIEPSISFAHCLVLVLDNVRSGKPLS